MIDVSVIITTRNEEANLKNCLESVVNQSYSQEKIEIIVVDNNSTDSTREIAAKFTAKVYTFGPERSAQRNFGVKQSVGKYLLYLDADMILSPEVIRECRDKCEGPGISALYIPESIIGKGFWIKVRDFERSFYNGTAIDCVRFVRRDKFIESGGFDEALTGPEDWDFDRRIKALGKTDMISSGIGHNEGSFSFSGYLRKKRYYGRDFSRYIDKWGRNDAIIRKQFGIPYRFFGVFLENGKWKKIIRSPILFLGVCLLRFFVGLGFLMGSAGKPKGG